MKQDPNLYKLEYSQLLMIYTYFDEPLDFIIKDSEEIFSEYEVPISKKVEKIQIE